MKHRLLVGVLILIIVALIIYTISRLQQSSLPLGAKELKGYLYLATESNNCYACPIIMHYWKLENNTCTIAVVETSATRNNLEFIDQIRHTGISYITPDEWIVYKGETPYLFDKNNYKSFSTLCNVQIEEDETDNPSEYIDSVNTIIN